MSQRIHKYAFPVSKARKYPEPGPVLLLSQHDKKSACRRAAGAPCTTPAKVGST